MKKNSKENSVKPMNRLIKTLIGWPREAPARASARNSGSSCIVIAVGLACFALAQSAHAVRPPPQGGYPGGNTAGGQNALLSLTTGTYNTAFGWSSLTSDTTGKFNTATGAGTLLFNTADQNTATGTATLLSNSTGAGNTANGAFALFGSIRRMRNRWMFREM